MTRHKAFETAAGRRRKDPIVWSIDDVAIRLRASVNLTDIGMLFEEMNAPREEGQSEMAYASQKKNCIEEIVRAFVDPDYLDAFETVLPDIELTMLNDMVTMLIEEYTGQANPMQDSSSSAGSSPTGSVSTDGARVED